jgi:uncharacterized membrane protein
MDSTANLLYIFLMESNRLEAFSDGVLAIIITIMVLELKVPHGTSCADILPILPTLFGYVLSFVYIGIYWNNHHHLFQAVKRVNGAILWANLHLLFWLSLVPFVTSWTSETHFVELPVALYGGVLLMSGVAYYILERVLINSHDHNALLAKAVGSDFKGKVSVLIYAVAIALAFWDPLVSCALYICVAILWVIPDRRIERVLGS